MKCTNREVGVEIALKVVTAAKKKKIKKESGIHPLDYKYHK